MIFGLKTLGDLKQKIRSRKNSYWASQNAIKILEEELLIKLIILEKVCPTTIEKQIIFDKNIPIKFKNNQKIF